MAAQRGIDARAAIVAASLVLLAVIARIPDTPAAHERPNVVLIVTDDQRADQMWAMPRTTRRLGARGTTFTNAFASYPLCCPSRATLFTGRFAHNHGVRGNVPPEGGFERFDASAATALPVSLQDAGYHTVHIGKYLNRYGDRDPLEVPPGWDEWYGSVAASTYKMWGTTLNQNGDLTTYGTAASRDPRLYQTDVYRRLAVDAIERNAEKPFFLSVAFLAPHTELDKAPPRPAPRHAGTFARAVLPPSPAFDEEDASDKPLHMRQRARLSAGNRARIRALYRGRLESLLAVDEAVAAIVRALARTGSLDRTLILFTSDNGFFQGEHRVVSGKYLPYDPATRVPLIMRGPDVPAAVVDDQVMNVDIAPTILAATGAQVTVAPDGTSLLSYAVDPSLRTGRPVLLEGLQEVLAVDLDGGELDGSRAPDASELDRVVPRYTAIRTDRFLYVEWENGERELYDLLPDPDQLESRHLDPRYAVTMAFLASRLGELRGCAGDECTAALEPVPAPLPL